ncbi:LOW QUALITY PROTEIN: salivary glue protein Sgs-3 [Drosophila tropicalis]|uniref:LOW QUALITY PROTEIN: salivary glue protein Sgs-3 n=1 Tax=Drosophila tropicalis TaxID=46794 RepID=UPI0035ABD4C9
MWLLKLVITLILATQLAALCDVCQSANNVACHNETAYSICMYGLPTNNFVQCPPNTYCTDDTYLVLKGDPACKSGEDLTTETTPADSSTDESTTKESTSNTEESTTEVSTSTTEESTSTTEGLTSTTTESTIPTTTTNPEPTTTTTPKATTTTTTPEPTTTTTAKPTTTTTTTTLEPTTTTAAAWDASCAAVTKVTLFANEDDPTCTTYIYCYLVNGVFKPTVRTCSSSKPYFNPDIAKCDSTLPAGCTSDT